MTTTTIRVPTATHDRLRRLAQAEDRPIGQLIEILLEEYEKQQFFAGLAEDFVRLRANPEAWADYQAELEAWDVTLKDGLEDEQWDE